MDNTNNKKDFSNFFDELNETVKSFNDVFNNCECKNNKQTCKNDKECCSQENNKCFNNFDPNTLLKGLKEFCDNITVDDIVKPIEALTNIVETGASTLTGLFEKFAQAIDQVADKFDNIIDEDNTDNTDNTEFINKEKENNIESSNEKQQENEGLTIPIGTNENVSYLCDNDIKDECIETPCCCKKKMTESEKKSIRDIIEEEIQRQFPEKQVKEEFIPKLNANELAAEVENKIKNKNFTFSNKETKEIKIELQFPIKEIDDINILFNEATSILNNKYHFSLIQFVAKGINDDIKIYAYIAL